MTDTPIEDDADPTQPAVDPGADADPATGFTVADPDEKGSDPVDPVQEGSPATGPEAPVPPSGSDDAQE